VQSRGLQRGVTLAKSGPEASSFIARSGVGGDKYLCGEAVQIEKPTPFLRLASLSTRISR